MKMKYNGGNIMQLSIVFNKEHNAICRNSEKATWTVQITLAKSLQGY